MCSAHRCSRRQHGESGCASDPDRKSTRLNSSHSSNSYAVFCLKKKSLSAKTRGEIAHGTDRCIAGAFRKAEQSATSTPASDQFARRLAHRHCHFDLFFFWVAARHQINTLPLHAALPI